MGTHEVSGKVKMKVKFSVCLTKYRDMKTCDVL